MFIAVRPHVKYSAKRPTRPRRPVLRAVEGIAPFDSLRSLRAGAPRCESQRLARLGDARAARGLLYHPAAAAFPFTNRLRQSVQPEGDPHEGVARTVVIGIVRARRLPQPLVDALQRLLVLLACLAPP